MRQMKHFLVFALLLALCNVQGAQAQGFFKKLAKAAGKVLEDAAANSTSTSSTSTNSTSSSGVANGYIPDVNFQFKEYEYWGNDVLARFVLTNTSSEEVELTMDNTSDNGNYCGIDENDNRHPLAIVVGDKQLTGLGDGYSVKLPAGVPVKGYILISKVNPSCKVIKSVSFGGSVGHDFARGDRKNYQYKIGSKTITYANNTNKENIFLSYPRLKYAFSKAYRSAKDIVLEGTFTNIGSGDYGMTIDAYSEQGKVYDSEGNTYNYSLVVGSKELSSYTKTNLPVGVPVKCKIVVNNVPASIHEFSLVKVTFSVDELYYLQFKNVAF